MVIRFLSLSVVSCNLAVVRKLLGLIDLVYPALVEVVVLDITEPVAAPVDEETPAPTEPNPESAGVEPPVVKTVGVFQVSDSENVGPVVGPIIDSFPA